MRPRDHLAEAPVQLLLMNAAVDLMPDFAREMHGLSRPSLPPVVRGATYGIAQHHCAGPSRARRIERAHELRAIAAAGAWQFGDEA